MISEDHGDAQVSVVVPVGDDGDSGAICHAHCRQLSNVSQGRTTFSSNVDDFVSYEATLISECAEESCNTVAILQYCQRKILKPRDVVFSFLGYRGWTKDGSEQGFCCAFSSAVYFIFVFAFLCVGPVLQYDICLRRDRGIESGVSIKEYSNSSLTGNETKKSSCSGSLLFVYIIPSLIFVVAYLVTCLVLRLGEAEHLQTLLERVYLLASCPPWTMMKQRRLGCVWVAWLLLGLGCLGLTLTSLILHLFASDHIPFSFLRPQDELGVYIICGLAVGSLWFGDIAIVVGVLTYCCQCYLLSTLLLMIRTALLQGSTTLMVAKKKIDETSRYQRHLNQELGMSVGLYLCVVVFRAVTGIAQLFADVKHFELPETPGPSLLSESNQTVRIMHMSRDDPSQWIRLGAMVTNLLPWMILTALPLITAARVSSGYRCLSKAGCQLHARPFGYQSTPQSDIDSFLLYVSSLHLQAKILWIPVRTHSLVFIAFCMVMVTIILSYLFL